jgi:hypothetical protein
MNQPLSEFLAALNAANSTAYVAGDFLYGTPQPVSGTWHGQVTTHNTAIKLTAVQGGLYQGTQTLTYDRLSLSALSATNMPGFQCSAYGVTTVHGLYPALLNWTGIMFGNDDLEDLALVDNGDNTLTATLKAKAGSLGWVGQTDLIVKVGGAAIDQVITVTSLNGLNYPTASDTDVYGPLYMYPYDFTSYFSDIATLATGVLVSAKADALVTAFKAVDVGSGKALWANTSGVTTWNVFGATVVSNGLNSTSLPTNPAYKYVLVLQLDATVTTPAGLLYLHYNDPFNPDAV